MEILNFCGEHPFIMIIILLFVYGCVKCVMTNIMRIFIWRDPTKKGAEKDAGDEQ